MDGESEAGDPAVGWWETAEDHKQALDALQLKIRRKILIYVGHGQRSLSEIATEMGLDNKLAGYHLSVLERSRLIERVGLLYRATTVGTAYLQEGEARR